MNNRTSQPNEKLRQARKDRGWSLWKAAAVMGLNILTLSRWEKGKSAPSNYELYLLCQFLRKTPEELDLHPHLEMRSIPYGLVIGATTPPSFSQPKFTLLLSPQHEPEPKVSSDDLLGEEIPTKFQQRLNCFLFTLFCGIMPLVAIVIGIALLITRGGGEILFLLQMLMLTTVICLVPTMISRLVGRSRRFLRALLECIFFMCIFLCFYLWIFGLPHMNLWILYVFAILLIIEAGGHIVEWHKEITLTRLMRSSSLGRIEVDARGIQRMFRHEVILYASFPLSIAASTTIGLFMHNTPSAIFMQCLQMILLASSLVLLYFLILGFRRMCNPMFRTALVIRPQATTEKRMGWFFKAFEIFVPPSQKPNPGSQKLQDLDFACDISEIRRIYQFDALHNSILFVVFTASTLSIWRVSVDYVWLIIILLGISQLFSEIPYAIGQYLLHQRILDRYTGVVHAELVKQLTEYAPCFPTLPFLTSLMTAGTLGGFLFFLLNLIVQNASHTLGK